MKQVHGVSVMTWLGMLQFLGANRSSSSHTDNSKNNF